MDIDQLQNRVEWLDDERRKDKGTIADAQKRIAKLEGLLDKTNEYIKDLSSEVTRLSVLVAKVDEFDGALSAHRTEVKKELDTQDARVRQRETENKKLRETDLTNVNKTVADFGKKLEVIPKLRTKIQGGKENETRVNRLIAELEDRINSFKDGEATQTQSIRSLEDDHRQEGKRITDLQGEVAALRKRTDQQHGKTELSSESQRKVEIRLNELIASESERRESQTAFIEKVSMAQSERAKEWNAWQKEFERFENQTHDLTEIIDNIDETERAVRKAQQDFEEITAQLERRINEITEMQRLGEERFRQEWATFRADDQKRWTNYTLTQEEQYREVNRQLERQSGQGTTLDENLQELRDIVQHLSEQSEKRLQVLLGTVRDWVAEQERFSSSVG